MDSRSCAGIFGHFFLPMAVILTSEIMGKMSQLMNTDRATGTMPEDDLKCLVSRKSGTPTLYVVKNSSVRS